MPISHSNDNILERAKEIPLNLSVRPLGLHNLEDLEVVVGMTLLVLTWDGDTASVRDVLVCGPGDLSENWAHNSTCHRDAENNLLGKDCVFR
jgi:hypothetical protein